MLTLLGHEPNRVDDKELKRCFSTDIGIGAFVMRKVLHQALSTVDNGAAYLVASYVGGLANFFVVVNVVRINAGAACCHHL